MIDIAELNAKYSKQEAKFNPNEAFRQLTDPDATTRLGASGAGAMSLQQLHQQPQ
jgi:hypothetical protein